MSQWQNQGQLEPSDEGGVLTEVAGAPAPMVPKRNSGLGVASFVLAVVNVPATIVTFAVLAYLNPKAPEVIASLVFTMMGANALAFLLGVASLFINGHSSVGRARPW
jgi:hypothetical protein